MAETIREMVIRMSFDAGGMQKGQAEIKRQIRLIDSEIKGLGTTSDSTDKKMALLGEKLAAQKKSADELSKAIETAKGNLEKAETAAEKLQAGKDLTKLETQLTNVENAAKKTADEINRINGLKFKNFGNAMQTAGKQMKNFARGFNLYVTAPLLALGTGSYNAFKKYEGALAGVKKTVDETDTTTYDVISDAMLEISEQIPVTYEELMGLGEAAGALGVGADQLIKFVRTVADLSATTDDLDAQHGANVLARLLNITEQGNYQNIDRVAAALIDLGNKTAATEGEIAEMAQRMASTGELAGFSTAEILALAAGFTSVGINAEAGGSAAGKLMKKMQLAAEVGGNAMHTFAQENMTAGMSLREIQLAADDAKWVTGLADALGMTKKEVKSLVDSGAALEQFSGVMGLTAQQYIAGWDQSAAGSMMDFFQGLANLETSQGEESILSLLNTMGLTEIRLSNLIAAAASNPQLFAETLQIANEAYVENIALADEANKRYSTTAAQDTMMYNKMENNMADLGENVATAIEPVKTAIDGLLDGFKGLSEVDQQKIINVMGALVLAGGGLTALGSTVTAIGSISNGIGWFIENRQNIGNALSSLGTHLSNIATNPIFAVVAAGAAIFALISFLDSLPTETERILGALANIQINVDEASKDATLAAIAEVRNAADALTGEKAQDYEATATAVALGYGTNEMFGQSLEYQRQLAEKQVTDLTKVFVEKRDDLNRRIVAAAENDPVLASSLMLEREELTAGHADQVQLVRDAYTERVSALINGMMLAQPEAKAALERASQEYDVLAMIEQALGSDSDKMGEAAWAALRERIVSGLSNLGYGEQLDLQGSYTSVLLNASELLMESLKNSTALANDGTLAYTLLNTLLSADGATTYLDFTQLQGALDGIVETLDFKQAAQAAIDNGNADLYGDYLTSGLAEGVINNAGAVADTMEEIKSKTLAALRRAFAMHSPSLLMMGEGINISAGLAEGIEAGAQRAYAAMDVMQRRLVSQAAATARAMSKAFADNLNMNGGATGGGMVVNVNGTQVTSKIDAAVLAAQLAALNRRQRTGYGA